MMNTTSGRATRQARTSAGQAGATGQADRPTSRSYRVQLPHVPPRVIADCADPTEAYERYKQESGIWQSDHDPQIDVVEGE